MYQNELKALEQAFSQLSEQVNELRVNALKLPEKASKTTAAWQIEDARGQKLFVALSGTAVASLTTDLSNTVSDLVFNVEAEIGQFIEVSSDDVKTFLELNYSQTNLSKIALTEDQRLMVVHRRWFEEMTTKSAFDAIAEVWNVAQNLRESLNLQSPAHA